MTTLARLRFFTAAVTLAWSFDAAALDEHEKEHIRALSNEAANDYGQHDYDVALGKFLRAYQAARVPKLAVWCARANVKLGRLVAAFELYQEALSLKPNELWKGQLQQQAQRDAQRELDELRSRIPKITIMVQHARPEEVSVTIDEVPVPSNRLIEQQLQNPGTHRIAGKFRGIETSEAVTLAEGEVRQVVLRFNERANEGLANPMVPARVVPTSASNSGVTPMAVTREYDSHGDGYWTNQRTWGLAAIGVGASAFLVGATTGLVVALKYGELSDKCDAQRVCQPRYQSEVDHYETMRTLSTIGFVVAGVVTTTGITLILSAPKRKQQRFGVRLSAPVTTIWSRF